MLLQNHLSQMYEYWLFIALFVFVPLRTYVHDYEEKNHFILYNLKAFKKQLDLI